MKKKLSKEELVERESFMFITYVAALRYFEYRNTIVSSMYPGDLVKKLWVNGNAADKRLFERIADQFVRVDHWKSGEKDWDGQPDCDRLQWAKFYQFCHGVRYGFAELTAGPENCSKPETMKAFHVDFSDEWYDVDSYLMNTECTPRIIKKCIKKVDIPDTHDSLYGEF